MVSWWDIRVSIDYFGYVFWLKENIKQNHTGLSTRKLSSSSVIVCIVTMLREYILRINKLRKSKNKVIYRSSETLWMAGWSSDSIFAQFYNKKMIVEDQFARAVL